MMRTINAELMSPIPNRIRRTILDINANIKFGIDLFFDNHFAFLIGNNSLLENVDCMYLRIKLLVGWIHLYKRLLVAICLCQVICLCFDIIKYLKRSSTTENKGSFTTQPLNLALILLLLDFYCNLVCFHSS